MTSPLAPDDRAVVARAAEMVTGLCDELRPGLLEAAGTIGSEAKQDGTPVTAMDLSVDRRVRDRVAATFPDHGVVSEEGDTVWRGHTWTWVVDPIDGTSNFLAGIPYWCVSIALLHEGLPVYACIEAPPIASSFIAVVGEGATRNGMPIRVAAPVDFRSARNAHVPMIVTAGTVRRGVGAVALNARLLGSAALDLAMAASGAVVATSQRVAKIWDMAAGSLLVTEAGGCYLPMDEGVLPPAPGTDLASRSCPAIAGPEREWLRELAAEL